MTATGDCSASETGVRPGAVTRLLAKLAEAPPEELGGAWDAVLHPGAVVGRFELVRELGRGGFGVVWEAKDRELGRHVAFKAVRAGGDAALKEERLLLEAEAAARLSHPNIIALHDVGRSEHGPFLVLELLRGMTLADRLAQGPMPAREAVAIAVEIATAMAHAHAHGVIHRDLKPANVFLCDEGRVKVLDFGLSHAFGRRRASGGTPAYMAPEQLEGAPEDERTDVFALGVVLYEMLLGRTPFAVDGSGRPAIRPEGFVAPTLEVPDAPGLGEAVSRLLAARAVDRPRDGAEVLDLLSPILRGLETTTPSGAPARARRGPRWWPPVLALAGVVAIAMATRPRPVALDPAARVVVAVADFANETGDRELDGLSGLLTTSLQQSPRLRVLTRGRMLDLLRDHGGEAEARLDERRAREVGRRADVGALVLASVRRLDDVYVVEVRVLDPGRDEYLFTTSDRARGKANVLGVIDRLSERTRAALHEDAAEVRQASLRIADVTSDLEAHRSYFAGKTCVDRSLTIGEAEPCVGDLELAVAKDPGFALAWLQLAGVRMWAGGPGPGAREAIANALRFIDRAPPREAVQIRALAAQLDGLEDQAADLFRDAAAASPDDRTIQFMAADFFLTRGDLEGSLPYWRRGTELEPAGEPVSAYYLAKALGALGLRPELEALADWLERAPPTPRVLKALCRARACLGDAAGAVDAARRANAGGELAHLWLHGLTPALDPAGAAALQRSPHLQAIDLARRGRLRDALALKRRAPANWLTHHERAQLAARTGQTEEAWAETARALALEPVLSASLAVELAYAGDLVRAEEVARRLAPGSPRERTYRAVVLWKRGERQAALDLLDRLGRETPWTPLPAVLRASLLQGEILSELGRDGEAIRSLSRYGAMFDPGLERVLSYPRSLFLLARSHERLGHRDEARAALDELLGLWRDADPDLPLLADARALRRRIDAVR